MDLLKAFFLALISFLLNEYIFYSSDTSYYVNFIILLLPFFLSFKYNLSYSLFLTLVFSAILLCARPREIHLIPIDYRGSFDYYSFHSQKLLLFSFSTITLLVYFVILAFRKRLILKTHILTTVIFFVGIVSQIVGLLTDKILMEFIVSDLKWFIAFFIGVNITFNSKELIMMKKHLKILMYSTIILTFLSMFNDFLLNDFKFKYSINFIYLVPIVGLLLLLNSKKTSLFLLNIPVTTTDIFLYLLLIFKKIKLKYLLLIGVFALILSALILSKPIDKFESDSFSGFLYRESKINSDLSADKSLLVRYFEMKSFWEGSSLNIMFGRGFGGYFNINKFPLWLDLSDFSEFELINKKYNQPHSFITYLLIKFGFLGFLLIIYLTYKFSFGSFIFRCIFTLSILSSFYWVPLIAFIWGAYTSILNKREKIPDFSWPILQEKLRI